MTDQTQQDNGDSLMEEKDKEIVKEYDIKEKEKGKQLAEDVINTTKVEIFNRITSSKDEISSRNSPCDDKMAIDGKQEADSANNKNIDNNNNITASTTNKNNNGGDQHYTLEDLSELACKIESDQKDNGHVAICVTGQTEGSASASDDDNTPLPLWVKWRGKWQTGIRCPSFDCPSSTLKAKPTTEMKSYIPVFFPRSKAYCWISTLHSKPITEAPEPLKNGSHAKWRKIVRDWVGVTRSYAVGKLALAMMSLTEQLHVKAVVEEARKGDAWKEFALEASKCKNYSDLGNMLVKLRNMILSDYISSDWLNTKFDLWVKNCQQAQNAESIEHLTEELVQNILWKRIEELWTGSTTHPDPNPEWKTLKQDMTKLFITSRENPKRPITNPDDPLDPSRNSETPQQIITKRPKLEIRRPGQETNLSDTNKPIQISDPFDPLQSTPNTNKSGYTYRQCAAFIGSKGRQCERWANDKDIYCCVHLHASGNGSDKRVGFANPSDPLSTSKGNAYRQCAAFIESKGRQCERWASDKDIYCCVHLNSNNSNNSSDKRVLSDSLRTPNLKPNPNPQSKSGYTYLQCAAFIESKGRQCERWASENEIYCCVHLHANNISSEKRVGFVSVSADPPDPLSQNASKSGYTYRQCSAFIEAKGRQCERWANDNDLFCCVHLNVRVDPVDRRAPLDSPLCKGLTTNGTNCKHRAKPGSDYCKKHRVDLVNHVHENNVVKSESGSGTRVISFGTELMGSQSGQISFVPTPVPITVPLYLENKSEIDNNNNVMNSNNVNRDNKNDVYAPSVLSMSGDVNVSELRCIGERANANENFSMCFEYAKKYELYCQNHIPKFLKRARDGRSRPITKDVILNLLKTCPSRKEKLLLHRACELLYGFLKSKLLVRKPKFDMSDKSEILFSLVSKDPELGEYLVKLISQEREKLSSVWGLLTNNTNNVNSSNNNNNNTLRNTNNNINNLGGVKCKFCLEAFSDDQALTLHWTKEHKKEARYLFRGYACKLCNEGFNNRKLLESHIVNKHGASESVQDSTLFRCICCGSRFLSPDPLWQHVLAFHVAEFRLIEDNNNNNNNVQNNNVSDLGNVNIVGNNGGFSSHRRGKYQLSRFKFKKSNNNQNKLKNMVKLASNVVNNINSNNNAIIMREMGENENVGLGALADSDCADVAKVLFSEIRKSNRHPSNLEILSLAREVCCRTSLLKKLEEKFGVLQNENVYLKAAKLCSESDVAIEWFKDGFVCLKGCKRLDLEPVLDPLSGSVLLEGSDDGLDEFEGGDYHVVLDSKEFEELNWEGIEKEEELGLGLGLVLLCEDLSFGKEKFVIPCYVDDQIRVSVEMPWKEFTYVTERVINSPIDQPTNDEELGCGCSNEGCISNKCDHAYLFENDYENALDISGESMQGKFAYDQNRRVILQEGFPVYECNSSCKCDASCQNRVVQNGVHVKLEVFRTKSMGWAVRAGEAITRGTFICEIIGEVINNDEAVQRKDRQRKVGCDYLCEIEPHMGHAKGMMSGETLPYVIDSFKFGNVSRFINHSCSPNLSTYIVLSESMDCQLAHVALFANRNIDSGEELGYDYRYKIIDGFDGEKCYCGAQNCRGRIY